MRWELAITQISHMEDITLSQAREYASHPATGTFIIVPIVACSALLLAMVAPVLALFAPAASTLLSMELDRFTTLMALALQLAPMDTSKTVAMFALRVLRLV